MKTVPLACEYPLRADFTAKLIVPLDLSPAEAQRLKNVLEENTADPSEAAKFACVDPHVSIGITE